MFLPLNQNNESNDIDLDDIYKEYLNEDAPGYELIGAKYFSFPVKKLIVNYTIIKEKRLNIIEKQILKAGTMLTKPVYIKELPEVLGLSYELLYGVAEQISELGLINKQTLPKIELTNKGLEILKESISKIEQDEEIILEHDLFTNKINPYGSPRYKKENKILPKKLKEVHWEKAAEFDYKKEINKKLLNDINKVNGEIIKINNVESK